MRQKSLKSVFNVSFLVLLQHYFLSFLRDAIFFFSEHSELGARHLFLGKVIFSDRGFLFPKVQLVEFCFYFHN